MSIEVELVSVYEGKVVRHLGILLNQNPRRKHVVVLNPRYLTRA